MPPFKKASPVLLSLRLVQRARGFPSAYLLAPPASGETMVQVFHSAMFSLIHFSTAGSAYRLSTGISKKPL